MNLLVVVVFQYELADDIEIQALSVLILFFFVGVCFSFCCCCVVLFKMMVQFFDCLFLACLLRCSCREKTIGRGRERENKIVNAI